MNVTMAYYKVIGFNEKRQELIVTALLDNNDYTILFKDKEEFNSIIKHKNFKINGLISHLNYKWDIW